MEEHCACPCPTRLTTTCWPSLSLWPNSLVRSTSSLEAGRGVELQKQLAAQEQTSKRPHRSAPATELAAYLDASASRCRAATPPPTVCMAGACTAARLAAPPVVIVASWAPSARAAARRIGGRTSAPPAAMTRRLFGDDGRRWPEATSTAGGGGPVVVGAQGAREVSIHDPSARSRTLPCVLCFLLAWRR